MLEIALAKVQGPNMAWIPPKIVLADQSKRFGFGSGIAIDSLMEKIRKSSALASFSVQTLSIFLTLAMHLPASAQTAEEAHAIAEKYLNSVQGETPRGKDIACDLPKTFKFYKFERDENEATPALCKALNSYATNYSSSIMSFWPFHEEFGMLVTPIKNIGEFNASFEGHPPLNKMTLSKFHFLYLEKAPVDAQKVVWTHEAGHAALQEIMDDHFYPIARAAYIKRIENQVLKTPDETKLATLERRVSELNRNWNTMTPDDRTNAAKQRDALQFKKTVLEKSLSILDPTDSLLMASFHEFFADLFAVILYEDLNVVGQAFDDLGLKSFPSDYRRFAPQGDLATAENWHNLNPHLLLTPARHYYGAKISNRIKDKKLFLLELAKYFIQILENPDRRLFLSFESVLKDIDAAQNPAEVAAAIESRRMKSELFSSLRSEEIKNFCDVDITACKIKISEQLKLGRNGIFQSNVDPKIANAIIINALETVLRKSMQLTN